MLRVLIVILSLLYAHLCNAVVTRHDTDDALYTSHESALPALVTFTTLHKGKTYVVGSGTYIGDGWVLTAAHVANFFKQEDVAELCGERLSINEAIIHEKWRDRQFGYDIALVKIELPSKAVEPVSLFSHQTRPGDVITITGKGDSGNGLSGMSTSDNRLRVAQNVVDKIEGQWISFTFNAPDNGALMLEGVGGGGDSGSPAYIERDGVVHVVGVSSWQNTEATEWKQGFYGVKDYYTHLIHYQDWVTIRLAEQKVAKPTGSD